MRYVQVPTTLVAQVDSAYGGKTGVDLPEAKNYVGAYHQPDAVLVDHRDAGDAAAGRAGRRLRRGGEDGADRRRRAVGAGSRRRRPRREPGIIRACARTKLRIVAQDERDGGLRQVLNLGHTVGHAIETATGYARYRHGEAVALGLLAALRLSGRDELRDRGGGAAGGRGLPTQLAPRDRRRRRGDGHPRATRSGWGRAAGAVRAARGAGTPRAGMRGPHRDLIAAVRELSA